MISGYPPFNRTKANLKEQITSHQVHIPKFFNETTADLILRLLDKNPKYRPNIRQIKQHKFFKGIDWEKIKTLDIDKLKGDKDKK